MPLRDQLAYAKSGRRALRPRLGPASRTRASASWANATTYTPSAWLKGSPSAVGPVNLSVRGASQRSLAAATGQIVVLLARHIVCSPLIALSAVLAALRTELIGDELSAGRLPGETPGDELAVFAISTLEAAAVATSPAAAKRVANTDLNRSPLKHDRSQGGTAHGRQSPWTSIARRDETTIAPGDGAGHGWPSGFSPSAQ
jgi:hypothetical protein